MSLKSRNKGGNGLPAQNPIEPGVYPARIVQLIDLGLQPQADWNGQKKGPVHKLNFTFELVTEFCTDENGKELEDKPRWISEIKPIYDVVRADGATTSKWYKALDPTMEHGGDFGALLGASCMLTVVQNEGKGNNRGKIYNNVGAVTAVMKGFEVPELINPSVMFSITEPDLEVFNNLPDWLKDLIKSSLEYNGSPLQEALGEPVQDTAPSQEDQAPAENTAENPW